ncbi:MAG: SRPBCC family protein [Acidobacteriota bacterium]
MKVLIIIAVSLVALLIIAVAVVVLIGSTLPKDHVASRSIRLQKTRAEVYGVVRDFSSAPSWRTDLKQVELMPQSNGRLHFREDGKNGTVNYELVEDLPEQRLVTRILDTDLGYSGNWTYEFAAEGAGTRVKITENGEVSNVIFRFLSKYAFGHTATIDTYLTSLAKHFGENAQPE